jgi:ubiquinone/menaquinone biosynthesis C-methylase UbiE
MPTDRYTHGHHESVLRSHRWRTAENSAGYLLPHLQPGLSLLDVGCGPGTITADLAARVAPGLVTAVDNAEPVLASARETLGARGVGNVDVRAGDIYALEFPDANFDVVHAHQVLQHLSRPVAALAEMRRLCKPGGVVAVRDSDYPAMAWHPDEPGLDHWMEVYLAVARGNGAEPAAGRRLLEWAQGAGFSQVTASASVWCFASPEERAWWSGLWADRVEASDFAHQAVEGGHATLADLAGMATAWQHWGRQDAGWFVVVHGEVICSP